MSTCPDNRPTGVSQTPLDTEDYPFLAGSTLRCLIADLRLETTRRAETVWPLFVKNLGNFGPGSGGSWTYTRRVLIHDAADVQVYDSESATSYRETAWGSRLVSSWTGPTGTLQVVHYPDPAYPDDVSPSQADGNLQPRATIVRATGLTSIRVGSTTVTGVAGFLAGNNIRIESSGTNLVVHCEAGEGAGVYKPCPPASNRAITSINNVLPTDDGRFFIRFGDCFLPELVTDDTATPLYGGATTPQQAASSIRLHDYCGACCKCDQYLRVYKAVRRVQQRMQAIAAAAEAVRVQHTANTNRWNAGVICRINDNFLFSVDQPVACRLGMRISYRNPSNLCLQPVELRVTVTGWTGIVPTMPAYGTLYYNNVAQPVAVSGTWPNFFVSVPFLKPGQTVGFRFLLKMAGCLTGDTVTVIGTTHTPDLTPMLGAGFGSSYPYVERIDRSITL